MPAGSRWPAYQPKVQRRRRASRVTHILVDGEPVAIRQLENKDAAMTNVVVIGSQWGDEGKGKIVDWLSERADVVVRFQGGHNAGHTLVIDGEVFKLSLLPSGVVRSDKLSMIGNGVVIDPWALLEEIDRIEEQGVKLDRAD